MKTNTAARFLLEKVLGGKKNSLNMYVHGALSHACTADFVACWCFDYYLDCLTLL